MPIIIRAQADIVRLEKLALMIRDFIHKNGNDTLVLASIDFCHWLSREETNREDLISMGWLYDLVQFYPMSLACDSPNSVYLLSRSLAGFEKSTQIIYHADNETYTGMAQDNITSYIFSLFFIKILK